MAKVISIESVAGPHQAILQDVLRMVPDRDRGDLDLQRLLAFRLRADGEDVTREYLLRNLHAMNKSAHKGRLYDFLSHRSSAATPFP